jgi:hypothetical protein
MTPQAQRIRQHLLEVGSITNVEANAIYKCRSVSRRITEITREDPNIVVFKVHKTDATGQRYVRYVAMPVIHVEYQMVHDEVEFRV